MNAWDRLPAETDKAYNAFSKYIAMPLAGEKSQRRSFDNLAAILGLSTHASLNVWSKKFSWMERARAHDMAQTSSIETVRFATSQEIQRAVVQQTGLMLLPTRKVIEKAIENMQARLEKEDDVKSVEVLNLVKALTEYDNLARRIAGLPTNYIIQKIEEVKPDENDSMFVLGGYSATED